MAKLDGEKFINKQNNPPKLYYSWDNFDRDVGRIIFYIKNIMELDLSKIYLVGLMRGGLPLAVKMSNLLKDAEIGIFKFQTYSGKNDNEIQELLFCPKEDDVILVVDDIFDTGNTFKKVDEYLKSKNLSNNIYYISLFSTDPQSDFKHYSVREKKEWVVYPWE